MKITPIRLKRINAGFEIDEAVKELCVSKSTFYKVEQGHMIPSRDLILKMSRLYQCSIDEIFKALKIN